MNALKAQWVVTAELIPGHVIEELTRVWQYTSGDHERDTKEEGPITLFMQKRNEAMGYCEALQDPSRVNIVRLEFMWL